MMIRNLEENSAFRDLLEFLKDWEDMIFNIIDWEIYRRVAESTTANFQILMRNRLGVVAFLIVFFFF
jgi:hypothetical protein